MCLRKEIGRSEYRCLPPAEMSFAELGAQREPASRVLRFSTLAERTRVAIHDAPFLFFHQSCDGVAGTQTLVNVG